MRKNIDALSGFFLVGLLVLSACGPVSNPLTGTSWVLVSLDGNTQVGEALGGQAVTLMFTGNTEVGGSGGCNSFGGQYSVSGNSIAFSEIVSTLMACTGAGIGDVEAAYFSALNSANRYEITLCEACPNPEMLTISGAGHTLVFEKV